MLRSEVQIVVLTFCALKRHARINANSSRNKTVGTVGTKDIVYRDVADVADLSWMRITVPPAATRLSPPSQRDGTFRCHQLSRSAVHSRSPLAHMQDRDTGLALSVFLGCHKCVAIDLTHGRIPITN
jgi:hypothetical protein